MYKKLSLNVVLATFVFPLLLLQGAYASSPVSAPSSIAKPANDSVKLDADFLKAKVGASLGLTVTKVEATPIPDIALIVTDRGLFYSSYNGEYLIQGKVYNLGNTGVVDLTEQKLAELRLEGLKNFNDKDIIVYKAENEKYVVNVFTDITCGYCRKMHAQMDEYNARGITFNYLAYPRSGLNDRTGGLSQGYKDLRSVWCNKDSANALTLAKQGSTIDAKICETSIEAQYNFGRQIGVNGTPAIILSNGTMIPGYQPPEQLEQILKSI